MHQDKWWCIKANCATGNRRNIGCNNIVRSRRKHVSDRSMNDADHRILRYLYKCSKFRLCCSTFHLLYRNNQSILFASNVCIIRLSAFKEAKPLTQWSIFSVEVRGHKVRWPGTFLPLTDYNSLKSWTSIGIIVSVCFCNSVKESEIENLHETYLRRIMNKLTVNRNCDNQLLSDYSCVVREKLENFKSRFNLHSRLSVEWLATRYSYIIRVIITCILITLFGYWQTIKTIKQSIKRR